MMARLSREFASSGQSGEEEQNVFISLCRDERDSNQTALTTS